MFEYVRDPQEIYRQSFAAIEELAGLADVPESLRPVARRLVHTTGLPEVLGWFAYSANAAEAGRAALNLGAPILADVEMAAAGITRRFLPNNNEVICALNDPAVPGLAQQLKTTRTAAALDLWRDRLDGAVVAIGNAPTALFRLLEMLENGAPKPALIIGMPVGFVGAVESKQALIEHADGVPFMTLTGRVGGSSCAAAAVNALVADNGGNP